MNQNREGGSKSVEAWVQTAVMYLVVIGVALVAGYYLAVALIPTPKIGIINLQTQVSTSLAEVMSREISYAQNARDIKAVVLVIDSPGGGASAGQDIYYQVRKLRAVKPVVASIDSLGASAAYQIGVAANEIYAKPTSFIGSIGVIAGLPRPETLSEQFITTGPFKSALSSPTSWLQKLDLAHADFRDSVVAERSAAPNPLKISPSELATGEIWLGVEAKQYGLIDEFGSVLDATARAAELVNLKNYEVVDVREAYLASLEEDQLVSAMKLYDELDAQPEFDLTTTEKTAWPSLYQLYIPLE